MSPCNSLISIDFLFPCNQGLASPRNASQLATLLRDRPLSLIDSDVEHVWPHAATDLSGKCVKILNEALEAMVGALSRLRSRHLTLGRLDPGMSFSQAGELRCCLPGRFNCLKSLSIDFELCSRAKPGAPGCWAPLDMPWNMTLNAFKIL